MNILLTNDDGYGAAGLECLYSELEDLGNIYIAAPAIEKSGTSHAITVFESLNIDWYEPNRVAIHGFPADCVNIALHSQLFNNIDLVVSGINHGPNMGDDVIYSGTVAGARQGFMHGINSIAVSLGEPNGKKSDFVTAAIWTRELIQRIWDGSIFSINGQPGNDGNDGKLNFLFNVNVPVSSNGSLKGFQFTRTGKRKYIDEYNILKSEKNNSLNNGNGANRNLPTEVKMQGIISHEEEEGNTDFNALKEGYISVTPLKIDQTDYQFFEQLKESERIV